MSLTNLPRYIVGLYFLWAFVSTMVSRVFLNLRAAAKSDRDWVSAGIQMDTTPAGPTHTIGGTGINRAPVKDNVYTFGYDEDLEMFPRGEYPLSS